MESKDKQNMERESKQLTLGSLFDGSGGFPLSGMLAGIKPIWASEIEPYPIRVTTKRFPQMKHYGDVSVINGAELEPVDIVTWGSPCQDLSIAGKRAGLEGERSGLYVQAVRIVKEMLEATHGEYPKFCVFENVPGLLSSNKGEDFLTCMDMMQEQGFIPDINILDAQHMGVAQRRKRVYITWVNVDYILRRRTNISGCITLQLLTEILLLNLGALLRAYGIEQKNLVVPGQSQFEDSMKRRIKLFSLQKEDRLQMLQSNLEEIQAKFSKERISSGSYLGEDQMAGTMLIGEGTKYESLSKESLSTSTGQLLRNALEESLQLMNESIISTQTKETIAQRIFGCFLDLRNTLAVTIHLMHSWEKEPMFLNCFEWVTYSLTEIRGYTDAGIKHFKGSEELERYDLLRIYKQEISELGCEIEQYLAEQCGEEILPDIQSLPWDSLKSCKTWQTAAGDPEKGSGETGGSDGGIEVLAADGYNGTVSEKAATLRVNCGESTGSSAVILNDQGGERMDVTKDVTATLRAEAHHPPVVLDGDAVSAGFCTEHSADSRGIGYEEEKSPTLRAGVVPAALKTEEPISLENHPNDSRVKIIEDGKVQTLSGRMGTGGGNVPLLMEDKADAADKPVTLKIRSGCEGGGKGSLLTEDLSATLGTHNDQTLFEPVEGGDEEQTAFGISSFESHAMLSDNPHAGIYEAKTSRTLDVSGGNPSCNQGGICIVAHKANYDVRFTSDGSKVSRGHVYETDTARTLSTDTQDPAGNQGGVAIVEEEKPIGFDRYNNTATGDVAHTLDTGAGNTIPMVAQSVSEDKTYAIEGNGTRPSHKGDGYSETDKMYTLNATEQHAIAFADKAATLSANDGPKGPSSQMLGNPENNFVAEEGTDAPAYGIDRVAFNSGKNANFNFSVQKEVEPTMVSRGPNAVSHPVYHSSKNSYHTSFSDGDAVDTLVASDYKDPPTVTTYHSNHASGMNADFSDSERLRTLAASDYKDPPTVCREPYYIVRRLTPTECARLQGLPDWWAEDLGTENPTEEDLVFWREVFETHRKVVTGASKPKTDKQIIKWLKDPQSDSAQYKMYGNGIAIPCAYYVLSGIVYYAQEKAE